MKGFLIGLGIGVGLGLLFAPMSGEETRNNLADRANDLKNSARETYEQNRDRVHRRAGHGPCSRGCERSHSADRHRNRHAEYVALFLTAYSPRAGARLPNFLTTRAALQQRLSLRHPRLCFASSPIASVIRSCLVNFATQE